MWTANKRIESTSLFLKIVEQHPANIPALIDASRALGELFNYQKARELLDTVEAVGARSSSANYLAGQTYRMLRQYQAAERCLLKAIELEPNHVNARLELAILLERSGRLAEASEHLEQRRQLLPNDGEANFLVARILRRNGYHDSAADVLNKLTDSTTHPLTRARCFSELCTLYDQQQQYNLAWQAMLAGNETIGKVISADVAKRRKRLANYQHLAKTITSDHLFRWKNRCQSDRKQQTALLTGVPRSGTTLMAKLIHGHPLIVSVDEHPAFARFGLPLLLGRQHPETLTLEFLDQLTSAKVGKVNHCCTEMMKASLEDQMSGQLLVDKNPSLLPILIPYHAVFANAPVIVALRDPRDILISCLFTYMPVNDFAVDMTTVDDAIDRISQDLENWLHLKTVLPESSWLEIRYEDLVDDCEYQRSRILSFFDLPDKQASPASPAENASEFLVHSPSYEQVAAPVHGTYVNRWKNYEQFLTRQQLSLLQSLAEKLAY